VGFDQFFNANLLTWAVRVKILCFVFLHEVSSTFFRALEIFLLSATLGQLQLQRRKYWSN